MDTSLRQNAGLVVALAAAGLSTVWFSRKIWAYWVDCALATRFGLSKRKKDNVFLEGVYQPVEEELQSDSLEVSGSLPSSLNGVFARVGPNPYFQPLGDYHV